MIKVNLLKNMASKDPGATQIAEGQSINFRENKPMEGLTIIWKILALLLPLVALYMYEQSELNAKEKILAIEVKKEQAESQKISVLRKEYREVSGFKEEGDRLMALIRTISDLSKNRLDEITALDALQGLTPRRVWFTSIAMEGTALYIKGLAVNGEDVSNFVRELTESIFFNDVGSVKVIETKTANGALKKFEVSCVLEIL